MSAKVDIYLVYFRFVVGSCLCVDHVAAFYVHFPRNLLIAIESVRTIRYVIVQYFATVLIRKYFENIQQAVPSNGIAVSCIAAPPEVFHGFKREKNMRRNTSGE